MRNIYMLVFALLALAGCRTNKDKTKEINKTLPLYYSVSADSLSRTPNNWRSIVFDSVLTSIIDSALKHNFELRSTMQKVEIARSGVRFTKGIRLPDLNASALAGQRRFGYYTMDGIGNYDTKFSPNLNEKEKIPEHLPDYYLGFQSSWEIDVWGKLKNKKKAAAARFMASRYGRDLIITNLVAEITATYFELIAVSNELEILDENIILQQDALNTVTAQMQAGQANQLGVDMMKAQLLNSKAIYTEASQHKTEFANKLNFLCGDYPQLFTYDSIFTSKYVIDSIQAGIPSDLLNNRPDIRQAEMEINAANADLASAKYAFYPSVNINAAIGYQAFNTSLLLETPTSVAYSVLGGLTAPLLNRRKLKAELMSASSEQKLAYINYEKAVVNGFMEVYNALTNIKTTKELLKLKEEESKIFKQSISTSSELFKAGRAGYLEVVVAQKNALQSQLELIEYKKRQQMSTINLYRSLGGGWH